jgi:hypothetical protein
MSNDEIERENISKKNRCQLVLARKTRDPCHLIRSTKYEKTTNHNFQYIKY